MEEEKETIVCLKSEDKAWYDTKLLIGYLELTVCAYGNSV